MTALLNRVKMPGLAWLASAIVLSCAPQVAQGQLRTEIIEIDAAGASHPFPHYWERMFGSGRAILSLRDSYRGDLRLVREATAFEYVRFHAILHDEVGVYDEADGKPHYNFSYVDQIYDGLLSNGVRPFVEVSFMPKKLAAEERLHRFWYRPNVSPPKDWTKWDDLVSNFAQHLADRYGIEEVSRWYFEVWNEPNLDFWAGEPKQATYFQLYDHTARALKKVNPGLGFGGQATAKAAWVSALLPTAPKARFRWTSSLRMSMPTTWQKTFLGPTSRFRGPRWFAGPRTRFTTKSKRLRVRICPLFSASTTPVIKTSRR